MSGINIWPVGTPVELPGEQVCGTKDGIVTAVCIRHSSYVMYEITWWDGRTNYVKWFSEIEFSVDPDTRKQRLGFNRPEPAEVS